MHAYYVTRALTVHGQGQRRTLQPALQASGPATTEVIVPAQRELERVRAAITEAGGADPRDDTLRLLPPAALARVPGLPVTLGAGAFAAPEAEAPPDCLVGQLQALRAAHPGRQHFRLLLVNAFGAHLGDNLIGLTAFGHVLAVLRAHLPEPTVDVLLGWHLDDRLARLFRGADGIDTLLTQGPTLAELSRYQAVFDTSTLIKLPRYGQMPMVDWCLWWLGLDPSAVPAGSKRNAIAIAEQARAFVAALLPAAAGPRILVNPKASTPLRSMPGAAVERLVEHLLAAWPQAQVVLTQPLATEHPRLLDLSAAITDADRLAALVAQADGLIGVDTYTQHLADATSTPAVTLYTSVPPGLYPYYPLVEAVLLPGAQDLPAWGKMKIPPDEWARVSATYEVAWQALEPGAVLAGLQAAMARKAGRPAEWAPRPPPGPAAPVPRTRTVGAGESAVELPWRQRSDAVAAVLDQTIAKVAAQVLCTGDTVVQLGAGAGQAALGLARRVGHHGRLVAFEPRRELHQQLCANLAAAGIHHADTHPVMPMGEGWAVRDIHRLYAGDEHQPLQLANSTVPEPVVCWPLDALNLPACRLLVVCLPLPLLAVLQGARATLERLRPVALAGVFSRRSSAALESFFVGLGYRVRIVELGDATHPDRPALFGILVAEPAGRA
jgi:hypothetical protein